MRPLKGRNNMRFRITTSTDVKDPSVPCGVRHVFVRPGYPLILTLPDDYEPPDTWEPMDEAARRAVVEKRMRLEARVSGGVRWPAEGVSTYEPSPAVADAAPETAEPDPERIPEITLESPGELVEYTPVPEPEGTVPRGAPGWRRKARTQ